MGARRGRGAVAGLDGVVRPGGCAGAGELPGRIAGAGAGTGEAVSESLWVLSDGDEGAG